MPGAGLRCVGSDADAVEALGGFKRFPAWTWRDADVLDFVGWLRTYNDDLPAVEDFSPQRLPFRQPRHVVRNLILPSLFSFV